MGKQSPSSSNFGGTGLEEGRAALRVLGGKPAVSLEDLLRLQQYLLICHFTPFLVQPLTPTLRNGSPHLQPSGVAARLQGVRWATPSYSSERLGISPYCQPQTLPSKVLVEPPSLSRALGWGALWLPLGPTLWECFNFSCSFSKPGTGPGSLPRLNMLSTSLVCCSLPLFFFLVNSRLFYFLTIFSDFKREEANMFNTCLNLPHLLEVSTLLYLNESV